MILTLNGQQAALNKGSSTEYDSENRISLVNRRNPASNWTRDPVASFERYLKNQKESLKDCDLVI